MNPINNEFEDASIDRGGGRGAKGRGRCRGGAELNRVGPGVEPDWKAVGEGLQADPGEGPPPEGDGNNRV